MLQGKRALIFGIANTRSIAYGISKAFKDAGARLAFSYLGDAIKKRVEPISEELGGEFNFLCDLNNDGHIADVVNLVRDKWGGVDIVVHAVAFAHKEDLEGRYLDTSRAGFQTAMETSVYSLVALSKAMEPLFGDSGAILTLTYHGSQKVVSNYNVMGVAKAGLEASVRYLASEMGPKGVRVNAISAGPIKTLAASAVSGFSGILHTIEERAPLRRNVTTDEVGNAAAFLCSDKASAITGDILYVDSGYQIMGL